MNRKKKIKSILMAKKKKANAKMHRKNKPKYISKAERESIVQQETATEDSVKEGQD